MSPQTETKASVGFKAGGLLTFFILFLFQFNFYECIELFGWWVIGPVLIIPIVNFVIKYLTIMKSYANNNNNDVKVNYLIILKKNLFK